MFIEVYINGQHLHTYLSDVFGVHDLCDYIKFEKLEDKYNYRKALAAGFIEMVLHQLEINKIQNAQLYLVFPACFTRSKKMIQHEKSSNSSKPHH